MYYVKNPKTVYRYYKIFMGGCWYSSRIKIKLSGDRKRTYEINGIRYVLRKKPKNNK